jgi:hypothetical protein
MTATATNLQYPVALPTLEEQLAEFTDPEAIENCRDPLRRVAMVMVALSMAEADSLEQEVEDITGDTELISAANELMRLLNDASARLKTATDGSTKTYLGLTDVWSPEKTAAYSTYQYTGYFDGENGNTQAEAQKIRNDLIVAGVNPATISPVTQGEMKTGQYRLGQVIETSSYAWKVEMSKTDIEAATKNLQLRIDDLSSTTQQKQLFMQTLMGKFNGTYEVATAGLKKMAELNEAVIQNLKR